MEAQAIEQGHVGEDRRAVRHLEQLKFHIRCAEICVDALIKEADATDAREDDLASLAALLKRRIEVLDRQVQLASMVAATTSTGEDEGSKRIKL